MKYPYTKEKGNFPNEHIDYLMEGNNAYYIGKGGQMGSPLPLSVLIYC